MALSETLKRCAAVALVLFVASTGGTNARAQSLVKPETRSVKAPTQGASEAELRAAERALLEGLSGRSGVLPESSASKQNVPNGTAQVAALRTGSAHQEGSAGGSKNSTNAAVVSPPPSATQGESAVKSGVDSFKEDTLVVSLRRQLSETKKRNAELERQLEDAKGQLTMAETELGRMQTLLDSNSRARLGLGGAPRTTTLQTGEARTQVSQEVRARQEPAPSTGGDMQIATVLADKADLRVGPGKNNSALMTVSRGSRLAVEARQGEWLRVFAPNGQRAWVHASVVTFGRAAVSADSPSSVSTNQVRGFSSSLEDEAFQRIQSMTAGH
jgi:Bacterial SH3 domain